VKFSIAWRLFLAVLLTSLTVAVGGLWAWRATMEQGFTRYVTEVELGRLGPVADMLAQDYQHFGHWPDLAPAERRHWLGGAFMRVHALPFAKDIGIFPDREFMPPPGAQPPGDHAPGDGPPPAPQDASGHPLPPPDGFQHGLGPPRQDRLHAPDGPQHEPDRLALQDRAGLTDASNNYLAGMPAAPEDPRRPISVDGKVVGYLTLSQAADPSDDLSRAFLADQARNLLYIVLGCIAVSALAAALLAANFRQPIRRLAQLAQELARGRFNTRLHIDRSDEIGELAHNVNQLAHMLEQHETSRRQWVADTSHELRTPVSVLRAQIEAMQDGIRRPDATLFTAMHRQVSTLGKLIDDLYTLARTDVGELEYQLHELDPWVLLREEAEDFRARLLAAGLELRIQENAPSATVAADADRLQQLLANLLENSLRYTDADGSVALSASVTDHYWILQLDDSSPGVPAAALEKLGERFFRVEQSRSREFGGSGLGLALCRRIAEAHAGRLEFSASPLGGLRVQLFLPLSKKS
jgi:two-component system sensor histidine kinase BaeS